MRRSYKWYRKLAFRLITQSILNAHKVFQKVTGNRKVTFCDFLKDAIRLMVTKPVIPTGDPNLRFDETLSRLTGRHFPGVKKPEPGAKNLRPTKPCRVCSARKIKTLKGKPLKTTTICKTCPTQPGLHIECFEIYHTELD